MEDNSVLVTVTWMEVVHIREKLAEARHNEKFGWGAVILAAVLVALPSILASASGNLGAQAAAGLNVVSYPNRTLLLTGMDLAAGLFLLSGVLVTLGVVVALYCRFLRSRLFDELQNRSEVMRIPGEEA